MKIGINGFGRMGRLVMRAAWDRPDLDVIHINEPAGDSASLAHLLNFDSVHGRWQQEAVAEGDTLRVDGVAISSSRHHDLAATNWHDCDIVLEASGKFRSMESLQPYLDQGVGRVLVTAPVKDEQALNVVVGVNDHLFDPQLHRVVTAASCTTNCLAPVVKVLHEHFGIRHGSMTTIHDITNTQRILDSHHEDLRRARASSMSLIPTTTGSAQAITAIFPELKGRLNGHAIRVPLANASLTDCVFELSREVTAQELNARFEAAARGELKGILGYEERPLVSTDYRTDPRSAIVDALSTMVIAGTQAKVYVWYDNEWGYANRCADLLQLAAAAGAAR